MINVTKTYLPPFEDYVAILKRAWDKGWITNHGELVQELEEKLKAYLGVSHLLFCANGTVVLQMALKALNITREVVTTPFSYVATTNAILWEGSKPVFVDIDPETFCIDASKIESAITSDTEAILATHVYGFPCDIGKIDAIAKKYNLKVIYDGAHAFGCKYRGKSLLSYGDISTCSFHATKLFHTGEGGCVICNDDELRRTLSLFRSFGHVGDNYYSIGINAKNSELHAAMGLAVLPQVDGLIQERKKIFDWYRSCLPSGLQRPAQWVKDFKYNYSYFPVLFESEQQLLYVKGKLNEDAIHPRRYFFPSLNQLPYGLDFRHSCPVSVDISSRILCLPLYAGLENVHVEKIGGIIKKAVR